MNNVKVEETYQDFKFKDFVTAIYKKDPQDPFSLCLQFLDEIKPEDLRQLLAYFIVTGAKTLYNKELAQLTPDEIGNLREYLHSVGWDVSYEVETRMQKISEKDPNKETPVNYFKIDFFPADPTLNKHSDNPKLFK